MANVTLRGSDVDRFTCVLVHAGWATGVLGSRNNSRVVQSWADTVAAYRDPVVVSGQCEVTYHIVTTWLGNVQVELVVENTTTDPIDGWTAEWTFTGDESVYNSWGVSISQVGPEVTATGDGYGATIPPLGSVTVGFHATVTGTPTVPAPITCQAQSRPSGT